MKFLRRITLLIAIVGLNLPAYTTEREIIDRNACRTTSKDWDNLNILFPGSSLKEVIVGINTVIGDIDTAHLPTPQVSTGSLLGGLSLAIAQVDPTPNITLGQAINNVYTLLRVPVGPLDLLTVVQNINTALGVAGLNDDTAGKVNFILNLIGGVDFTVGSTVLLATLGGVAVTANAKAVAIQNLIAVNFLPTIQPPLPINYPTYPYVPLDIFSDLSQVISQINPGALTLGAAVSTQVTLIGVINLPPTFPIPIPYPYLSSGIFHTDLVKVIGQVDPTGGINGGQAVTNTVNKIGIDSTRPSKFLIPNPPTFIPPLIIGPVPANRVSSGIVKTDLDTFNFLLNAAPSASVGGTYQALMNRLEVFFNTGGTLNTIPPDTLLPGTLDEILTALGI
jgi:hypothetical protein